MTVHDSCRRVGVPITRGYGRRRARRVLREANGRDLCLSRHLRTRGGALPALREGSGRFEPTVPGVARVAAGRVLLDSDVSSGADMTREAALAKLHWLLGQALTTSRIAEVIGRDVRGELTVLEERTGSETESVMSTFVKEHHDACAPRTS